MIRLQRPFAPAGARAGAARVSIIWLITLIILFFVALGFGYLGFDEAAKAEVALEKARSTASDANERALVDADHIIKLSQVAGSYDESAATPRTDPEALAAALDDLRGTFPDLGADVDNLTKALPVLKKAYEARGTEIATLQNSIETLKSEKSTLEASLREASKKKDEQIAALQKQLQDDAANAASKQTELENRIATLNTQRNELDSQVRALRGDMSAQGRKHEQDKQTWSTRTKAVTDVLAFLDEPEAPDGEVLAVSKDLGIAWINIGARQRLAAGTRFSIVAGTPGQTPGSGSVKATAEVTEVTAKTAEVRILEVTDPFDPVVAGDKLYNPLFDPRGERHAVLAGRFTGKYDEAKLRVLLKDMGITVQDKLDFNTDYLIIGSDLWTDEDGNQLEEALSPTELPVYKDAEANGVQIVSIKTLASYFVF